MIIDGGARQKTCYSLDTNDLEATWQQMPVSPCSNVAPSQKLVLICHVFMIVQDTKKYFVYPLNNISNLLCHMQDMSKGRAYYQLISYGDAVYAMGGHDGSELDSMERWTKSESWVGMADLPYSNHRWGIYFPICSIDCYLDSVRWRMS